MTLKYPNKNIELHPENNDTLFQRALISLNKSDLDANMIKKEWFASKPTLFICGAGHIAKELADFAVKLDFRIIIMDDRAEFSCRERFPYAAEIVCDSFDRLENHLVEDSFYVVVTRGHQDDYTCVKKILGTKYRYLGMIGSKNKVSKIFKMLSESLPAKGSSDEVLNNIHAPIGLPIGASTPGEIAISILAEIIQEKNKKEVSSASNELLNYRGQGTLCIIIEKTGSSPRGKGTMMIVHENGIIDSVGGGPLEAAVIKDAAGCDHAYVKEYHLNNAESRKLGMICGGNNRVLFIPISPSVTGTGSF